MLVAPTGWVIGNGLVQKGAKRLIPGVISWPISVLRPPHLACPDIPTLDFPTIIHRPMKLSTGPAATLLAFFTLRIAVLCCAAPLVVASIGCGTTQEYSATEQLVLSDAVDQSIARIDFRPLSGRKVYLDTSYLRQIKGNMFVNAEYVTSALRQQIVAAGCLIQDSSAEADVIIEARIGTLGSDNHRVTFGVPENNALSAASSLIPGAPRLPSVPEIAFARREAREAAAKVAAFAYDRQTRTPIWQSGVDSAVSTARDTWVMGVGPFQGGSIREQTKLAGSTIRFGEKSATGSPARFFDRPPVDYTAEVRFQEGWPIFDDGGFSADMLGIPASELQAEAEVASAEGQEETENPAENEAEIADRDNEPDKLKR